MTSASEERRQAMKRIALSILLATTLLFMFTATLWSSPPETWRGSGGWGPQGGYGRMYNPATVETVGGTVIAVERITPMRGMGPGIHLRLKSESETLSVHLGPAWYLDRQEIGFQKGDHVVVKGSRVTMAGRPVIIAKEVRKGDELLKLRDESGIPVWSGWRRSAPLGR